MDWQTIAGLVARHLMTSLAGALVTLGLLQAGDQNNFISIASGILVGFLGLAWSWWQKRGQASVKAELDKLARNYSALKQSQIGAAAKSAAVLLALALGVLLASDPRAQAQPKKPAAPIPCTDLFNLLPPGCKPPPGSTPGSINLLTPQQIAAKIRQLSLNDFVYADALAKATDNKVTEPCWSAWVNMITRQQQPLIGPSLSETVTWTSGPAFATVAPHNLMVGQGVTLQNPPAGFSTAATYYVIAEGYTATTFELSAMPGGSAVTATGPSAAGTVLNSPGQVLQPPDPGLVTGVEYVSEAVQLLQSNSPIALACAPMAQAIQKDFATLAGSILSGGALGLFKLPVAIP